MSNATRPIRGVVVLLVALLVAIMIGCGGSGDGGGSGSASATASATSTATAGSTSGNPGSGTLLYTLQWPVETRALPPYTRSVVITVYDFETQAIVDQATINRINPLAHNQTVTFNLPPGKYTVVAEAKPDEDGGGDTIAVTTITSTVVNGQTASTTLEFSSLVATLLIDDLPEEATVGETFQLHAHAEDEEGNALLLPSVALDWTITSGGEFANVTSDGQLTLLAPGEVTIQVREIDTNVIATKSITLVAGSTNGVIVIVS